MQTNYGWGCTRAPSSSDTTAQYFNLKLTIDSAMSMEELYAEFEKAVEEVKEALKSK